MFHSKLRHISSNSLIDISPIYHSENLSIYSHNQNRILKSHSNIHHQLCHSYNHDNLDREFLNHTKQTCNKLFHQSHFNELLDQIQQTLQPIAEQLREKIEQKKIFSKQDQLICMKSCIKLLIETLRNNQWNIDEQFLELKQLQNFLEYYLSKQRINNSTQTDDYINIDEKIDCSTKLPKISIVSTDDLAHQKHYHRSISRAFRKLNLDLQKLHHETPFQSHLSKYHKHNHENKKFS